MLYFAIWQFFNNFWYVPTVNDVQSQTRPPETLQGLFLKRYTSYLVYITAVHHWRATKYVLSIWNLWKKTWKRKKNSQITATLIVHFGKPFLMVMFLFANSDNRWRCDRCFSLWIKDGCSPIEDSVKSIEKLSNKICLSKSITRM